MTVNEEIFKHIKEMPEMEAKKLLAEILTNFMKVNRNGYTKDDCYRDVEQIYGAVSISAFIK